MRILSDPIFGGPFSEPCSGTVQSSERAHGLTPAAARESKFVYWIEFDRPQLDRDGDGPYSASQVLSTYVRSV